MLVFARAVFVGPVCAVGGGPPWPCRRPPTPRPGPLAPLPPAPTPNFARNSPTTALSFELRSLELQRFWTLLKLQPIELRASFRRQRRATTHQHRSGAHLHAAVRPRKREKTLPARAKHPKISTFSPAGRILSRSDLDERRAHPSRPLRPQPKPCVARPVTTTPVAHWPHD